MRLLLLAVWLVVVTVAAHCAETSATMAYKGLSWPSYRLVPSTNGGFPTVQGVVMNITTNTLQTVIVHFTPYTAEGHRLVGDAMAIIQDLEPGEGWYFVAPMNVTGFAEVRFKSAKVYEDNTPALPPLMPKTQQPGFVTQPQPSHLIALPPRGERK